MTEILKIEIDGVCVKFIANKYLDHQSKQFKGQKMHHAFGTRLDKLALSGTLLVKADKRIEMMYDDTKTTDEMRELLKSCEVFHMKHDGSCGCIVWDNKAEVWVPYARFDIKRNNKGKFESIQKTDKWIPCEVDFDENNLEITHYPHFRPISEDLKAYKHNMKAFELAKPLLEKIHHEKVGNIVTLEYMGKMFNGKLCDYVGDDPTLLLHGSVSIDIPEALRTFEGIRKVLEAMPLMEGIVCYPKDHAPLKIRREIFDGLHYPSTETFECLKVYGYTGKGLSADVILKE